jgi:hypothetical protein
VKGSIDDVAAVVAAVGDVVIMSVVVEGVGSGARARVGVKEE